MRILVHEKPFTYFPRWYNENSPWSLRYNDLSQEMLLTLNDHFPLITDFEVTLESYKGSIRGYEINFFSQKKGGGIMHTLFSDEHLRRAGFAPPLNFDDLDQGWTLTIVTKNEFVYLWEGNFDRPDTGIQRWFKVPKERYYAEWLAAIDASIQLYEGETEQERLRRLAPPGQSLYGIQMLSAHHGWAVGGSFDQNGQPEDGCILQYQDKKWIAQQVEVPLLALAFFSEHDGWAVGDQGTILCYDQAGWTRDKHKTFTYLKTSPLEMPFHCVVARWSNDAWIVGDKGEILNTTKKGWGQMWSVDYHLNSLSLSSSGGWWAVGEKGVMIQCKARSYHDAYRLDVGSLYSVSMLSEEDGWCFGAKGMMLRYNGSTWEVQATVSSKDLRGSHFLSPLEGWCVGQDNTILHYQQGFWTKEEVE